MLTKLLWMGLAGACGTLLRFGLAGLVHRFTGPAFPWGTLIVNVVGCFVAGMLWVLFETRWPVSAQARTLVLIGFMGAFTTFSAYILETGALLRDAEWLRAAANVALHNGLGFAALIAGAMLGRVV